MRDRAVYWYRLAMPSLDGVSLVKAKQRVERSEWTSERQICGWSIRFRILPSPSTGEGWGEGGGSSSIFHLQPDFDVTDVPTPHPPTPLPQGARGDALVRAGIPPLSRRSPRERTRASQAERLNRPGRGQRAVEEQEFLGAGRGELDGRSAFGAMAF